MILLNMCCVLFATAFDQSSNVSEVTRMVARKLEMSSSYHVRIRVESRGFDGGKSTRKAYTAKIWRLGDKFRFDITDAQSQPSPPTGMVEPGGQGARDITCQNCERPEYYIITAVYPGSPTITNLVGFHKSPALSGDYSSLNIDWRYLGLSNNRLAAYNLISFIEDYRGLVGSS